MFQIQNLTNNLNELFLENILFYGQGPQGDTGVTGFTGPQGYRGVTGFTGPQGDIITLLVSNVSFIRNYFIINYLLFFVRNFCIN